MRKGMLVKKQLRNVSKRQKDSIFQHRYRFYARIILFTLSGAIMIGHGTRMIYQGLFQPGSLYAPNTFDLFFDWLTLAILGCCILWCALSLCYHGFSKKTSWKKAQTSSEETMILYPT